MILDPITLRRWRGTQPLNDCIGRVRVFLEYTFRRLPAVFRRYPELRGVVGRSWFFDPELEKISPSLSFMRQTPSRWGATIMRWGAAPDARSASVISEHRRRLYGTENICLLPVT
jgi:hypothetical protein